MIQMLERDALKECTINSLISTTLFDPPKMTIIAYHFPGVNAVQGAVGCPADPRNSEGKQGTAGGWGRDWRSREVRRSLFLECIHIFTIIYRYIDTSWHIYNESVTLFCSFAWECRFQKWQHFGRWPGICCQVAPLCRRRSFHSQAGNITKVKIVQKSVNIERVS